MKEIKALTGLRGVAALVVFFSHTHETLQSRGLSVQVPELIKRLVLSGGRQVDIFFVLSGFILALIYRDWFSTTVTKKFYLQFLQRRFARIYPLHAFMIVLVGIFVLAAHLSKTPTLHGLERYTVASIPAHLLLVHAWGFLGEQGGYWNPPSWSVSIEALAYLLFPAIIWLTTKLARTHVLLSFCLVVACGLTLNWITAWGLAGFPGIARGLSEFALGCTSIQFFNGKFASRLQTNWGSLLSIAALLLCFALTPTTSFMIALCTVPLLLSLSGKNITSRFFSVRPIFFLGEISYSIYLGHFLFSSLAYRLISVAWMRTGTIPLCSGLIAIAGFVLALSTLTYYFIERPGRDLLRRVGARSK